MNYLNINDGFLLLDFKIYRPNIITNDYVITNHQKLHRHFEVEISEIIIKINKNMKNKK